jgi:hypothetical protein
MKTIDSVDVRIARIGDSIGIFFPMEYESLEGFDAQFSAELDGNDLVFVIRPHIVKTVRRTVDELWKDIRILFSKIGDIGDTPWKEIEIVWKAPEAYYEKVPIAAEEVIQHRFIRASYGKPEYIAGTREDMRKSISDTMEKLSELAALRLGFEGELFARAFGQSVASKFSASSCVYGIYDVVCEIFSEEFDRVDEEKCWKLTSDKAAIGVKAAYDRIRYLEAHPDEFAKERERIQSKWGFPLQTQ